MSLTPQQISDYKRKWMMTDPYCVPIHSDLRDRGLTWCKSKLDKETWKHSKFTNVYEDTFYFEDHHAGQVFEEEFISWVQK